VFDYVVWLLSSKSEWMPNRIRDYLIDGIKKWAVWPWTEGFSIDDQELGFKSYLGMGALAEHLMSKRRPPKNLEKAVLKDIQKRIMISKQVLDLPDEINYLINAFLEAGLIEEYFKQHHQRKRKTKHK
jgi:hypothetical protein